MKITDMYIGATYAIADSGKTDADQRAIAQMGHVRKGTMVGIEESQEYSQSTGKLRTVKRPVFTFPNGNKQKLPARRAIEPWNSNWQAVLDKVEADRAAVTAEAERLRDESERQDAMRSILVNQVTALLEGLGAVFRINHYRNSVSIHFDENEFKMFATLLKMHLK